VNKKLGYYTCDNIVFESKYKAMIYANPRNLDIQWHFNDELFNTYRWDIEPDLSLDELYDRRARQIREQYDYVMLSYSGGSDSNNILESFIRQGLHIDEIVTNWPLDISEKFLVYSREETSSWNHYAEFRLNVTERLNYIKNMCPNTKITINETSKLLIDNLLNTDDPSWYEKRSDTLNITGAANYNLLYFKDLRHSLDKNKTVAFVLGVDKPKLVIDNKNKVYLMFIDKMTNMISVGMHIQEYSNTTPLFFYWDPDCMELLAKQAHIMLKFFSINSQLVRAWNNADFEMQRLVQEEFMKFALYSSTWSAKYWQSKKTTKEWDSQLDYWFTRGMQGSKEHMLWLRGLLDLAPKISNFLTRDKDGIIDGSRAYMSKLYYIGEIKTK